MTKQKLIDQIVFNWRGCTGCRLHSGRTRMVFWKGNPEAKIFAIGEAPGAEEDVRGIPFVGPAGRLMDELLEQSNMSSIDDIFSTNIVMCRPPNNRTPMPDEAAACRPRLEAMIWAVQPSIILLVGGTAAQKMAGAPSVGAWRNTDISIDIAWRGKVTEYPAIVTWHPAYLLRNDDATVRQQFLDDIQAAREYS